MANVFDPSFTSSVLFLVLGTIVVVTTIITIYRAYTIWRETRGDRREVATGLVLTSQCLIFAMTCVALFIPILVDRAGTAWARGLIQGTIGIVVTSEVSIVSTFLPIC
jgi:cytochrome bd-type quinol oxidase subunit 1